MLRQVCICGLKGHFATALTLRPPENFNLAINGQIRQITILPNFPVTRYYYASVRMRKRGIR